MDVSARYKCVSESRKPRPHGGGLAWIETVPAEQLFLSAFTMGELQRGLELTYQNDIAKAREIHAWVDRLAGSLRVIPADGAIFRRWALLMHGRAKSSWEDALIAATAIENRLIVVTRNTRDFEPFKQDRAGLALRIFNPFGYTGALKG